MSCAINRKRLLTFFLSHALSNNGSFLRTVLRRDLSDSEVCTQMEILAQLVTYTLGDHPLNDVAIDALMRAVSQFAHQDLRAVRQK